jgi:hypothetical protein
VHTGAAQLITGRGSIVTKFAPAIAMAWRVAFVACLICTSLPARSELTIGDYQTAMRQGGKEVSTSQHISQALGREKLRECDSTDANGEVALVPAAATSSERREFPPDVGPRDSQAH